ncbi:TlpA family protein disulfide reductase [Penaeicola halotolerans]|uniref:TlpA family protein disulfide reductase n=1 Tax=Penaeicola halotolerans TaxID=2793196 RepID=UPI001CF86FA9|nr:redoxin domain-containing protein [Penaeicola halotolerans]
MKQLVLILLLNMMVYQVQAQQTVHFSGKINNLDPTEIVRLSYGTTSYFLELSSDHRFARDIEVAETPTFFYFSTISKSGKIIQHTPRIWFDNDSVVINLDWSDKSIQTANTLDIQAVSEKIESLKGKKQKEFILNNPNEIPSLYFADRNKEKMSTSDLTQLLQALNEANKNTTYATRIKNYVAAKKLGGLKKGDKVNDFTLPDETGQEVSVIKGSDKTKLIAIFSSGCQYSIASIKLLSQLSEINEGQIEIITIWDDASKDTWLNTHKEEKDKITWTNLWDGYNFAATYLNRKLWPSFYVVNKEGVLTDKFHSLNKKTAQKLGDLVN